MRDSEQRGPASTPNPATHATDGSLAAPTDKRCRNRLRLMHGARRHTRTDYWARLIAARYSLTLDEGRAEVRRLAAHGWQTWEFHTRFAPDRKDMTA